MSQSSGVYVADGFSEPMSAQYNFTNQYDLSKPDRAMSSYARIMHEHTKSQLNTATDSARRRSTSSSTSASTSPGLSRTSVTSTE
ncbi:hypothetical protein EJ04DRAFT_512327 [Polyplosphaeria fusca]|uniref:Uncharacterized protein n=1 Tax=Polyplosphaeria fusca TaxID=682080 RepID=A0A9P4R0M1_9PLEO|nr:hypothetical protein EJ04DRAFT_512327 [Polyplosphaeria fusca]